MSKCIILILCSLVSLLGCTQLQPSSGLRKIASTNVTSTCTEILKQFRRGKIPFYSSVEMTNLLNSIEAHAIKIDEAFKRNLNTVLNELPLEKRRKVIKSLSNIVELTTSKSRSEGFFDPYSYKIALQRRHIGTEVGAIFLVHELKHFTNTIDNAESEVLSLMQWMFKYMGTSDGILNEERSAFRAQRNFILDTHGKEEVENIEKIRTDLFEMLRVVMREERYRRIKQPHEHLELFKNMSYDEVKKLRNELRELDFYYSTYSGMVNDALNSSLDDYIEQAIRPYYTKQNTARLLRYIVPGVLLAKAGIATYIYSRTEEGK